MISEQEQFIDPIVDSLEILEDEYGFDISNLTANDWFRISKLELSEEFMEKYKDKIDWNEHFLEWQIDDHLIAKYSEYITYRATWESISYQKGLSKEFILQFYDKLDPTVIAEHQKVPLKIIAQWAKDPKSADLIEKVLEYQVIQSKTLDILIKYDAHIDWIGLSKKGKVSKAAFLKHHDSFNWDMISEHRTLTEQHLIEFQHHLNWTKVSKYQKMSIDFIVSMSDYININALKENKKVNQKELEDKEIYLLLRLAKS